MKIFIFFVPEIKDKIYSLGLIISFNKTSPNLFRDLKNKKANIQPQIFVSL